MVMVKGKEMDFVSKEGNKAKTSPCKKGLEKRVKVSGMGIRVVGKVKKKRYGTKRKEVQGSRKEPKRWRCGSVATVWVSLSGPVFGGTGGH